MKPLKALDLFSGQNFFAHVLPGQNVGLNRLIYDFSKIFVAPKEGIEQCIRNLEVAINVAITKKPLFVSSSFHSSIPTTAQSLEDEVIHYCQDVTSW